MNIIIAGNDVKASCHVKGRGEVISAYYYNFFFEPIKKTIAQTCCLFIFK